MSINELRKKNRKRADNAAEKKGKTGRTGQEPPKLTKVEEQLAGGQKNLQEQIFDLQGDVKTLNDSVSGANKTSILADRRLNFTISQINEKMKVIDKGMAEFADEVNLVADAFIEWTDGFGDYLDTVIEREKLLYERSLIENKVLKKLASKLNLSEEEIEKLSSENDKDYLDFLIDFQDNLFSEPSNDENEANDVSQSKDIDDEIETEEFEEVSKNDEPINVPSLEEMESSEKIVEDGKENDNDG